MGINFSSLRVSEYSIFVIIIFMLCIIFVTGEKELL